MQVLCGIAMALVVVAAGGFSGHSLASFEIRRRKPVAPWIRFLWFLMWGIVAAGLNMLILRGLR